ncbi:MAG: hypothetical protein LE178_00525 [Endomicrobium sp.]|nr:hypothetical protein [Endomicrobium sp.]
MFCPLVVSFCLSSLDLSSCGDDSELSTATAPTSDEVGTELESGSGYGVNVPSVLV